MKCGRFTKNLVKIMLCFGMIFSAFPGIKALDGEERVEDVLGKNREITVTRKPTVVDDSTAANWNMKTLDLDTGSIMDNTTYNRELTYNLRNRNTGSWYKKDVPSADQSNMNKCMTFYKENADTYFHNNDGKQRPYMLFYSGYTSRLTAQHVIYPSAVGASQSDVYDSNGYRKWFTSNGTLKFKEDTSGNLWTVDSNENPDKIRYWKCTAADGTGYFVGKSTVIGQQMFIDRNEDSTKHYYSFCCDEVTGVVSGTAYDLKNLEDSQYYSADEAKHIRYIALNGFWGVNSGTGVGTLSYFLNKFKAYNNTLSSDSLGQTYVNEAAGQSYAAADYNYNAKGTDTTPIKLTDEEINGITWGEALLATQVAIWKYGNSNRFDASGNPQKLMYSDTINNLIEGGFAYVDGGWSANVKFDTTASDEQRNLFIKRVQSLFLYLTADSNVMNANPTTTIIDSTTAFKSIDVEVKERLPLNAYHGDSHSDSYNTTLTITLGFVPSQYDLNHSAEEVNENPLKLIVTQGDYRKEILLSDLTVADYDETGKPVIVIDNVALKENEDIKAELIGTHGLDQGVYVFTPGDDHTLSQTCVTVASGTQPVKVSKAVSFNVEYKKDLSISARKVLNGAQLTAGLFQFTMTEDGSGNRPITVSNDASGRIVFPEIDYTGYDIPASGVKTIVYTIKEVAGSSNSYIYDDAVWKVEVTLKLHGDDMTAAITKITKNGVQQPLNTEITFVNDYNVTSVSGEKTWNDSLTLEGRVIENNDNLRPTKITVYLLADGAETGIHQDVVPGSDGRWTYTFTNLPVYNENGDEITYTVREERVAGYSAVYSGMNIENTHVPELTSISGEKFWNDSYTHQDGTVVEDNDGKRPDSITVYAIGANGGHDYIVRQQTVTVGANGSWTYSFTNLPKYYEGKLLTYRVEEVMDDISSEWYTPDYSDKYDITNTTDPELVDIPVTKIWQDNNDTEGFRPESIQIHLTGKLANGTVVYRADAVVRAPAGGTVSTNWTYTFTDLPKYYGGQEIIYTVTETPVNGYQTDIIKDARTGGYKIYNNHTPNPVSISGHKVWNDDNNNDGVRPEYIVITLKANGEYYDEMEVYPDANGNWSFDFGLLPKYSEGHLIEYTVSESYIKPQGIIDTYDYGTNVVREYDAYTNEYIYTVTNTRANEEVSVRGTKTWTDENDNDGFRPDSITIKLLKNGADTGKSVTLPDANGSWSYAFEHLDKYTDGNLNSYTVVEVLPEDAAEQYSVTYSYGMTDDPDHQIINIINRHDPIKISVSGTKTWNDNSDNDGYRPTEITVILKKNGEVFRTATVRPNYQGNWSYSFDDLYKYTNGQENVYTVEEQPVDNYSTDYNTSTDEYGNITANIINTHDPDKTEVPVSKQWVDENNNDGIRPEKIYLNLYGFIFTAPDRAPGEQPGEDFEPVWYPVATFDPHAYNMFLVYQELDVEVTPDENGDWSYVFENLPKKFKRGYTSYDVYYCVYEHKVEGYTTEYTSDANGIHIKNTHEPEKISINGEKIWNDNNNNDNKRPGNIVVNLYKNNEKIASVTVTPDANGDWSYEFTDLYKYENGQLINYRVTEDPVEEYQTTISDPVTTDNVTTINITNTHSPDKTSVSGVKIWNDENNNDGFRPQSIVIKLLKNDAETGKSVTLPDANGKWSYEFTDLDKYENGQPINYTIKEETDDENGKLYTTTITPTENGFDVVNTYEPVKIKVSGTKTWNDNNNNDGFRPRQITIVLKKNGENFKTATITPTSNGGWSFEFNDLYKYTNGVENVYTVEEVSVDHYTTETVQTADEDGNITVNITNTHDPDKIELLAQKEWVDEDDNDRIRPAEIELHIIGVVFRFRPLPEGVELDYYTGTYYPELGNIPTLYDRMVVYNETVTVRADEEGNWSYNFTNLPKYFKGMLVHYTIEETAVEGYETTYETTETGIKVTNTHEVELVEHSVTKIWNDGNNGSETRPETIKVQLYAKVGETEYSVGEEEVLSEGNNWAHTWEKLHKYDNGVEIEWSVKENTVDGYVVDYEYGKEETIITNTAVTTHTVEKIWSDINHEGVRPESLLIQLYAETEGENPDEPIITAVGEAIELIPDEEGNWPTYTWENLPMYDGDQKIRYIALEVEVPHEYTEAHDVSEDGLTTTITNTWINLGDHRNLPLYTMMTMMSATGAALSLLLMRNSKKEEEDESDN